MLVDAPAFDAFDDDDECCDCDNVVFVFGSDDRLLSPIAIAIDDVDGAAGDWSMEISDLTYWDRVASEMRRRYVNCVDETLTFFGVICVGGREANVFAVGNECPM
jgi:hypothetical protein